MSFPFPSQESRFKAAFISGDPRKARGLGRKLSKDERLRQLFELTAEMEALLQGRPEELFTPFERKIVSSWADLDHFYAEPQALERFRLLVESAFPRLATAAAAAVLLVVVAPASDHLKSNSVVGRGDSRAVILRPYCVPPLGDRLGKVEVRNALFTGEDGECYADETLILAYKTRPGLAPSYFHAFAVRDNTVEPVWITPNPARPEPILLGPSPDLLKQAWKPIRLSKNYRPGTYRINWFICPSPIGYGALEEKIRIEGTAIDRLSLPQKDCARGSFGLQVEEVQ